MARRSGIPFLVLSGALLSACTAVDNPIGPDPVIQAADAARSSDNYLNVQDIFIRRAGYSTTAAYVDWYEVAVAGFSYVDEQCAAYLDGLYRVRRKRDLIKSQLTSVGGTANSVLAITDASKAAIAITAAAFGLGSQITDNASAAVLYAMDPSDIDTLLKNQMQTYRNGVAVQRSNYTSSGTAMEAVRGYLSLCLPVTIEAQIKATVQNTVYVAVASPSGVPTLARVQTASPQPPREDQLPGQGNVRPQPAPVAANLLPGDIPTLTPAQVKDVQRRLCVTADGDPGLAGSNTRKALEVLQAEKRVGDAPTGRLDQASYYAARDLTQCDPAIHRNTYEHLNLATARSVTELQENLKTLIATDQGFNATERDVVNRDGFISGSILTEDNREAIKAVQRRFHLPVTGEYSQDVARNVLP